MAQKKQRPIGFSASKSSPSSSKKTGKQDTGHSGLEKQADSLINQDRLQEAEEIYRELINQGTKNHIIYGNLAAIIGMQGRFDETIELLKKTLQLKPNYADGHYNLGKALQDQGDLTGAITSYNTALQLNPKYPDAHNNLGNALRYQGDLISAIASYNAAIQLNPNNPDAHYNLGNALRDQGNLEAAITSYNAAILLNPNHPDVHNNLGNTLRQKGELTAAITCISTSIQLNPKRPDAHYNLGNALHENGDLTSAIASYNTAIQLNPNHPDTHNNLGNALHEQGNLAAAVASYHAAIQLNPNYIDAHTNLGNVLQEQGNLSAAMASYTTAIQLNPNHTNAHWNSSHTMLLGGDYRNGWEKYEWRFKKDEDASRLHSWPKCTKWNGEKLSKDHKLLLVSEQGLGDTLQFMRYANTLRNQGFTVSLCAQPVLHSLIQESGIDNSPLTPEQANLFTNGQWIPLLSVPKHLGVSPENPIVTNPYIKTTEELTAKWKGILSTEQRPIIGINWQGNPSHEKKEFIGRSLPLETFAAISSKTNATLLSLQKAFGSEQLENCSFKDRFVRCQPQVNNTWDFLETAAIIANCDLVITSDTSVAHLAAGMGNATWLLLKKVPEWRWGLENNTSFWYPSMRLFRQSERGNWHEVMERVTQELLKQFEGNFSPQAASKPAQDTKNAQDILSQIATDHSILEQQANSLINQGSLQEAEVIYRKLISQGTINHIVYGNLAAIIGMQGRFDEIIELLKKTLQLKPNYPDAHYNLGKALHEQGDLTAAIASYNTALQLRPNYPGAHSNLGNALYAQGNLTAAITSYNTAIKLNPKNPDAHYNLAIALKKQGNLAAAISSYNTTIKLNPNHPGAHNNLGNALHEQGDITAAIDSINTSIQLNPNYPNAHCNLGNALHEQGNLTAAIASYNTAIQLNPNHTDAHWNASLTMLLSGDYRTGWEKYKWRFKKNEHSSNLHSLPKCSHWNGEKLSKDHKLLLVSEQGLGDTLQFMRYAMALRNQGYTVSLCAQPVLHKLIQVSGIEHSPLTPVQANEITNGQWIPLLSAPQHLEVTPENPIITKPYIKTDEQLISKWERILSADKQPIIGINWQGNPKIEVTALRGRSLQLEAFAAIAVGSHASLLSLQKGFGSEQLKTCSFTDRFVTCQDQISETWDFLETAAIIANCDLIITSDTSVAHLAGGMGKTTWLLLHKVPDWRWGLEGDTSFWYPSMRLFRQCERGNWDEVMERVAFELQKKFGKSVMPQVGSTPPPAAKQ